MSADGTNPGYEQAGPGAHGFQEICTSSVAVALEWGLFGYAEGVLENYLQYFVRPGGRVLYRGEPQHSSQIVRVQAVSSSNTIVKSECSAGVLLWWALSYRDCESLQNLQRVFAVVVGQAWR